MPANPQLTALVDALKRLKPQILQFKESIPDYKRRLETISEQRDFLALTQDITRRENDLHQRFREAVTGLDQALFDALQHQAQQDSELKAILAVLSTESDLAPLIKATRERLSEQAVYGKLTGNAQQMARDFIQRLKQLRSVAQLLETQKEVFRQHLREAKDTETLAKIEQDIIAQNEGIAKVYQAIIFYPKEDDVAAALVEYFDTNPHLLNLVKAFHFYDALKDDLLAAKNRIGQS